MKEILSSKANDNFWMNDNSIYMSRGKVVNGESVGVGRASSSVSGGISYGGARSKSYNIGNRSVKGEVAGKARRETTPQEQRAFLEQKIQNKEWRSTKHTIGGKKAYYEHETDLWYTRLCRHETPPQTAKHLI